MVLNTLRRQDISPVTVTLDKAYLLIETIPGAISWTWMRMPRVCKAVKAKDGYFEESVMRREDPSAQRQERSKPLFLNSQMVWKSKTVCHQQESSWGWDQARSWNPDRGRAEAGTKPGKWNARTGVTLVLEPNPEDGKRTRAESNWNRSEELDWRL